MADDGKPDGINVMDLLLQFIGSLCICDHMGDVSNDVQTVLNRLGLDIEWDDFDELATALHQLGITTLYGTSLASEEQDDG